MILIRKLFRAKKYIEMHVKCRLRKPTVVSMLTEVCNHRHHRHSSSPQHNNVIFPRSLGLSFNGLLQQSFCCNINDANYDKLTTKLPVFYTLYSQSSVLYCIAEALDFLGKIMNILQEKSIMLWHLQLELSNKSNRLYRSFKHLSVKHGSSDTNNWKIVQNLMYWEGKQS